MTRGKMLSCPKRGTFDSRHFVGLGLGQDSCSHSMIVGLATIYFHRCTKKEVVPRLFIGSEGVKI